MRHSYLFIIAIMLAVITPRIASAQSIAVKSNVLYDLTGTFNLGGEIRCDDTRSFNPFSYTHLQSVCTPPPVPCQGSVK